MASGWSGVRVLGVRVAWAAGAALALSAVVACSSTGTASGNGDGDGGDDRPIVLATTSIWGDVVGRVVCDGSAEVGVLIPAGADPHDYEPSLADRARLDAAALIVLNGLGLEGSLAEVAGEAGDAVFTMSDHVGTLAPPDTEHVDPHAAGDPHVWLDPANVVGAIPALAQALIDEAGLDAATITACADDYGRELRELDAEIGSLLAEVPPERRQLVTNHDALGYFARRYDFTIVGSIIPSSSSLAQASPAQLEKLARAVRDADVPAIFTESGHAADDAEALAREAGGIPVVALFTDSLGDEGSEASTYAGMLRHDARLIAEALR